MCVCYHAFHLACFAGFEKSMLRQLCWVMGNVSKMIIDSFLPPRAGELYGRYVPQSVSNKDGQPMDIDIVLNEMFNDGDEMVVEYSGGPQPFRVR